MRKINKTIDILAILGMIMILIIVGVWWLAKTNVEENREEVEKNDANTQTPIEESFININGVRLNIEIADTDAKRTLGLSGRENLPDNSGLLFIFDRPQYHNFWMKDMNFPIDIIWIDANWQIVDITRNLSPDTYPETFTSSKPVQYVLETNPGVVPDGGVITNFNF